jgi:predicted nicotinamide N-methyase
LIGDLFYEKRLAARVTAFLDRCLEAGVEALIGDPQRAFLPRSRLRMLGEYPGPDFGDGANGGLQRNAVFSFEPARRILPPDCSTTPPRPNLPRPPFP